MRFSLLSPLASFSLLFRCSRREEKRKALLQGKSSAQVNVSLAPEELEGLDATSLKRKYEQTLEVCAFLFLFFMCCAVFFDRSFLIFLVPPSQHDRRTASASSSDVGEVYEEESRKKRRKLDSDTKKKQDKGQEKDGGFKF
jgi:hypothetical protein